MKSLWKLGLISVGDKAITSFISIKQALPWFVQEEYMLFFSMTIRGFAMVARLAMNLLTILTLPRKIYNPFLWLGSGRDRIVFTFSTSIVKPYFETMCLRSFPKLVKNIHLLGLRETKNSLHLMKIYFRWPK